MIYNNYANKKVLKDQILKCADKSLSMVRSGNKWYKLQNSTTRYVIAGLVLLSLWMISGSITRLFKTADVLMLKQPSFSILHSVAEKKNSVIKSTGAGVAKDNVILVSQGSGVISQIFIDDGKFVKAGTPLVQIDRKNYAELVDKAVYAYQSSEITFNAAQMLLKKRLISESDFSKAKAELYSSKAELEQAKINLRNAQVIAPFDGYVDKISVNVGDYTGGMTGNNFIGTFFGANKFVVKVNISEHDRPRVAQGQNAVVSFDKQSLTGKVTSIASVIDNDTHSFKAEITLDAPIADNISGQTADVIINGALTYAHKVPQSALSLDDDGNIGVKYLDIDKIVKFHEVGIVYEEGDGIWISGLPNEVDIITLGHAYIPVGFDAKSDKSEK